MSERLIVLALALVPASILVAGVAIGAESGGHGNEQRPATFDRDSQSGRAVWEDAQERDRERRAHRDSKEGRKEREGSRSAYRGQSDAEARDTARTEFPQLIGPWSSRWPALGEGDRLKRYLSDNAAVVETAAGRRAVVESMVPLRGSRPDGERAPVDLALTDLGDALAPKSSATKVRFGKDPSDALRFPDSSFGVRLAAARESIAELTYGKAFYPNALEDTDLVLQATPLGAEVALVLRSPQSPTTAVLDFQLGQGQQLRAVSGADPTTGGVEIVSGDEPVGLIGPALAVDAQGEPVEVDYDVRGDQLALTVDTSGDVAYPVAVDPVIYEKNEYGQPLPPSMGASWWGWSIRTNNYRGMCAGSAPNAFWSCPIGDATIWIKAYAGQSYNGNDFSAWMSYARAGAYVFRFDTQDLSHNEMGWPGPYTLAFNGICNAACNAWMPGTWAAPNHSTGGPWAAYDYGQTIFAQTKYYCVNGQAPPVGHCTGDGPQNNPAALGNAAQFGIVFETGGNPGGEPYTTVNGAAVYKTDNSPPGVTVTGHSSSVPAGWVKNYSDTVSVRGHDNGSTGLGPNLPGMGMGSITVSGGGINETRSTCGLSNNYLGCPANWDAPGIGYTAPEGKTTYTASAKDIIENTTAAENETWQVKTDRTAPTIPDPTGTLWDARNRDDDRRFQGLYNASYTLSVTANGEGNNTSDAARRSGVKRIDIEVLNAQTMAVERSHPDPSPQACPADSCTKTRPFTFNSDDYSDGEKIIRIKAYDQVDNPAQRDFRVTVDRRGDIYRATEYDKSPGQGGVVLGNESARIGTRVARHIDSEQLVSRGNVPCDPAVPNGAQCAEMRSRSLFADITPGDSDTWTIYRGSSTDDPNIEQVADILEPANSTLGTPAATGPIADALATWQTAPPGHGTSFARHDTTVVDDRDDDGSNETLVRRLWIDALTKMPLRDQVTDSATGAVVEQSYFEYRVDRLETSQVPTTEFAIQAPPNILHQKTAVYTGGNPQGPQRDVETNTNFTPYYLGAVPAIGLASYCFSTASVDTMVDRGVDPAGVDALFEPRAAYWRLNETSGTTAADSGSQPERVTNTSFEANTSGWATSGAFFSSTATLTRVADSGAPDGGFVGKVVTPAAWQAGLGSDVSVTAGQKYRIRVKLKRDAGGGGLRIALGEVASPHEELLVTNGAAPGATAYTEYTGVVTPTRSGTYRLYVRTANNPTPATTFYVDAASVRPINPGTYTGGYTLNEAGATPDGDKAVKLNGSTGYVTVPDAAALDLGDKFSIEAWFKRNSATGGQILVGKGQNAYLLWIDPSGKLTLRKSHVGNIVQATTTPGADGEWHHVVATKDGAEANIYLDGADVSGPVTNQTLTNNAEPLNLGTNMSSDVEKWNGWLDDVALYPRPLSPDEVLQLSASSPPSPAVGPNITFADAYYGIAPANNPCPLPGTSSESTPPLQIRSMAAGSSYAAALRDVYVNHAEEIMANPAHEDFFSDGPQPIILPSPSVAYVIRLDEHRHGALIEIGSTTVIVSGVFTKNDVPAIAGQLVPR